MSGKVPECFRKLVLLEELWGFSADPILLSLPNLKTWTIQKLNGFESANFHPNFEALIVVRWSSLDKKRLGDLFLAESYHFYNRRPNFSHRIYLRRDLYLKGVNEKIENLETEAYNELFEIFEQVKEELFFYYEDLFERERCEVRAPKLEFINEWLQTI